jgi:hypothetical protein
MESPSIHTREEQQRLLTPHGYTGEAFSLRYQDCVSCGHRTEFTCIKCGYCYSCHWKREQVEKIELRDNPKDFYASLSEASNEDNEKQKIQQDATKDYVHSLGLQSEKEWRKYKKSGNKPADIPFDPAGVYK